MKTLLMIMTIGLTGCMNPFAGNEEAPKKEVIEVTKETVNIFGLSISELKALSLNHSNNPKLQERIKRRIYLLTKRIEAEKRLRVEIELNGLKAEFKRLKALRERYSLGSFERKAINKTIRAIKAQIVEFNKKNPLVKPVNRKPAALYSERVTARSESLKKIVVRNLKKELRLLLSRHNKATGKHKKELELEINKIQNQLAVLVGEKQECV